LQGQGEKIPIQAIIQAQYDAEEAELQKAIEESKALQLQKDEMNALLESK